MMGWLGNLILKQKLAAQSKRKLHAFNMKSAKSVLILYEASQAETEQKVRNFSRYFKEEGLKVDSIGFYKKKGKKDQTPANELSYYYFDQTKSNWLGIPTDLSLKKIIMKEHHLLIDLNFEQRFCLKYLALLSRAHFKVGRAEGYQEKSSDLSIVTEDDSLDYLIDQIKVYLNMINTRKE